MLSKTGKGDLMKCILDAHRRETVRCVLISSLNTAYTSVNQKKCLYQDVKPQKPETLKWSQYGSYIGYRW